MIGEDTSVNTWQFINVAFARIAADNIWFTDDTIITVEEVLGGNGAPFVDLGGRKVGELQVRAVFEPSSDGSTTAQARRDQVLSKRGATGTLTNGRGRSCKAVLRSATPAQSQDGFFAYADLTFVWVAP